MTNVSQLQLGWATAPHRLCAANHLLTSEMPFPPQSLKKETTRYNFWVYRLCMRIKCGNFKGKANNLSWRAFECVCSDYRSLLVRQPYCAPPAAKATNIAQLGGWTRLCRLLHRNYNVLHQHTSICTTVLVLVHMHSGNIKTGAAWP